MWDCHEIMTVISQARSPVPSPSMCILGLHIFPVLHQQTIQSLRSTTRVQLGRVSRPFVSLRSIYSTVVIVEKVIVTFTEGSAIVIAAFAMDTAGTVLASGPDFPPTRSVYNLYTQLPIVLNTGYQRKVFHQTGPDINRLPLWCGWVGA